MRLASWLLLAAVVVNGQTPRLTEIEYERRLADEPRRTQLANDYAATLGSRLGFGTENRLELRRVHTDTRGGFHARYRQKYKNVRILGGEVIVHMNQYDQFRAPTARTYRDVDMSVSPSIAQPAAEKIAGDDFAPRGGELKFETELVIAPQVERVLTAQPARRAVADVPNAAEFTYQARAFGLAWLIRVHSEARDAAETSVYKYLIEANTGRILRKWEDAADEERDGWSRQLKKTVKVQSKWDPIAQGWHMIDDTRNGNFVRNNNHSKWHHMQYSYAFINQDGSWGSAVNYDENWSSSSEPGETAAVDVALGIQRTHDLLKNVFGWNGLNNKGESFRGHVHYKERSYENARWVYYYRTGYFGDGGNGAKTNMDVVGHEIGHGLWGEFMETNPGNEAGGLNEGHGDILGSLVNYYHAQDGKGYLLPHTFDNRMRFRIFNPKVSQGYDAWEEKLLSEDVHVIGAVYGHAFVFLALGASKSEFIDGEPNPLYSRFLPKNVGMAGIGVHNAAEIWFHSLDWMPEEPKFWDARDAWRDAAIDLWGSYDTAPVRAVENAFAAINVGNYAGQDTQSPEVAEFKIEQIDETEGSIRLSAVGKDNFGIQLAIFGLSDGTTKTLFPVFNTGIVPYPLVATLDLSKAPLGQNKARLFLYDHTGNFTSKEISFVKTGALNQALTNGGFESGNNGWSGSGEHLRNNQDFSFLGTRYLSVNTVAHVRQTMNIPAGAHSMKLSYRVRVNPVDSLGGQLHVRAKFDGKLLTLNAISGETDTTDAGANHYRRFTHVLGPEYAGKPVELQFETFGITTDAQFRLDAVSVTYKTNVTGSLSIDVHEGEQTAMITLSNIVGVTPDKIGKVTFQIDDGAVQITKQAPYRLLWRFGTAKGTHKVTVAIYDLGNNLLANPDSEQFTIKDVKQVILNGEFEQGPANWQVGLGLPPHFGKNVSDQVDSFSGERFLLMGGKGIPHVETVYQGVKLPLTAKNAKLSFRLRIESNDPGADNLVVQIVDGAGDTDANAAVLKTMPPITSAVSTGGPNSVNNYARCEVDLAEFAGKSIRVRFRLQENLSKPSSFYIDAVNLTYTDAVIINNNN